MNREIAFLIIQIGFGVLVIVNVSYVIISIVYYWKYDR